MAVARNTNPKWEDPDSDWIEEIDGPTIFGMTKAERNVDRFHNHEEMSPEAMVKAIHRMQATIDAMDARLTAAEDGSSGAVVAAKDLGVSMVQMGDAMSKRLKSLEDAATTAPAAPEAPTLADLSARPAKPGKRVWLAAGLAALVLASIGAVVLLQPQPRARAAAATPALYAPSTD